MTARVVIQVTSPETITQLNSDIQVVGNPQAALQNIINYLKSLLIAGDSGTIVQVTVRDNAVSVTTSGTSSSQNTHTL